MAKKNVNLKFNYALLCLVFFSFTRVFLYLMEGLLKCFKPQIEGILMKPCSFDHFIFQTELKQTNNLASHDGQTVVFKFSDVIGPRRWEVLVVRRPLTTKYKIAAKYMNTVAYVHILRHKATHSPPGLSDTDFAGGVIP